jgi:hypothetical protein
MSYGIIFWGNSADSKKVFYMQWKIIRIMAGSKRRETYGKLFKKFNVLPLASKFLLSLSSFEVESIEKFHKNSDIQHTSTRYTYNSYMPSTNLTKYKEKEFTSANEVPPISLLLLHVRIYLNQKFSTIINTHM